jgi:hypothetical protein
VVTANLTPDGKHRNGGIDIPRWWGDGVTSDLCRAFPAGGIADCDGTTSRRPVKVPVRVALK